MNANSVGVKKLERSLWAMTDELAHHFENEIRVENASAVGQIA